MCESLDIGTSSYYDFFKKVKDRTKRQEVDRLIIEIFSEHKRRYGARRIVEELKDRGIKVGRAKVRSTMKSFGLIAIQPKSFVPRTTQSNPHLYRNPNQLLDREPPSKPNEVIVGDITYLPLKSGGHVYCLVQSMTRRDNHYDNAVAESLFFRLKNEQEKKVFKNIEDARSTYFEDIVYYNTKRKHSSIGNKILI